MKNNNRIKRPIICVIVLLGYIYSSQIILKHFYNIKKKLFVKFSYYYSSIIISIIFGVLLGLEKIINEYKKRGKWCINIPRLLIIGIPFAFLTFFEPIYFSTDINFSPFFKLILKSETFEIFTGIILGYTLITSIDKVNNT